MDFLKPCINDQSDTAWACLTKFRDTLFIQYQCTTRLQSSHWFGAGRNPPYYCAPYTKGRSLRGQQDFLSFLIIAGCWGKNNYRDCCRECLGKRTSLSRPSKAQGLSENWISGISKSHGLSSFSPWSSHISQPARLWCSLSLWQRDSELPGWSDFFKSPEDHRGNLAQARIGYRHRVAYKKKWEAHGLELGRTQLAMSVIEIDTYWYCNQTIKALFWIITTYKDRLWNVWYAMDLGLIMVNPLFWDSHLWAPRDDGCLRAYWDVMDQCGALRLAMARESHMHLRHPDRPSLPRLLGSKCWMCHPQIVKSVRFSKVPLLTFKLRGSIQKWKVSAHQIWSLRVVSSKAQQLMLKDTNAVKV